MTLIEPNISPYAPSHTINKFVVVHVGVRDSPSDTYHRIFKHWRCDPHHTTFLALKLCCLEGVINVRSQLIIWMCVRHDTFSDLGDRKVYGSIMHSPSAGKHNNIIKSQAISTTGSPLQITEPPVCFANYRFLNLQTVHMQLRQNSAYCLSFVFDVFRRHGCGLKFCKIPLIRNVLGNERTDWYYEQLK